MSPNEDMAANGPKLEDRVWPLKNIEDGTAIETRLPLMCPVSGASDGSGYCPVRIAGANNLETGALMEKPNIPTLDAIVPDADQIRAEAFAFLDQFWAEAHETGVELPPGSMTSATLADRKAAVVAEISKTGTYVQTLAELTFGCRVAWRNAPRCIYRVQWTRLRVLDCRHVQTSHDVYLSVLTHLRQACTSEGIISSLVSVFPPRSPGAKGYWRIWNAQLIRYAGYTNADGSILGDPYGVIFTQQAMEMGWTPPNPRGPFDILPLIVQDPHGEVTWFDLQPQHATDLADDGAEATSVNGHSENDGRSLFIREVNITHFAYPKLAEANLKWYAIPAISNMGFDIGGIQYCCTPFNGWYMETEITRNFLDRQRYNLIEKLSDILEIERNDQELWKDQVQLILNQAVLWSFAQSRTSIVGHHAASDSFMVFFNQEMEQRGHCPADWVWIVPPAGSGVTTVFHQEMLSYFLKPMISALSQPTGWNNPLVLADARGRSLKMRQTLQHEMLPRMASLSTTSLSASQIAVHHAARHPEVSAKTSPKRAGSAAKPAAGIFPIATTALPREIASQVIKPAALVYVIFGSESGRSESFARRLVKAFKSNTVRKGETGGPDIRLMSMDHFADSIKSVADSGATVSALFAITSTFGDGESPANACRLLPVLTQLKRQPGHFLQGTDFAVLALGSSAYPNTFCAFGQAVDAALAALGAHRLEDVRKADECKGQTEIATAWIAVYKKWFHLQLQTLWQSGAAGNMRPKSPAKSVTGVLDIALESASSRGGTSHGTSLTICPVVGGPDLNSNNAFAPEQAPSSLKPYCAKIIGRVELVQPVHHDDPWAFTAIAEPRSTMLVKLDISQYPGIDGPSPLWEAGDHLAILPSNPEADVNALVRWVILPADIEDQHTLFTAEGDDLPSGLSGKFVSLHSMLRDHLEIMIAPDFDVAISLVEGLQLRGDSGRKLYQDPTQLQSPLDNAANYDAYCVSRRPNFMDIIFLAAAARELDCSHVGLPLHVLLTNCEALKPRWFSISSAPHLFPGELHLTIQHQTWVVRGDLDKSIFGSSVMRSGVASGFMTHGPMDMPVRCWISPSPGFHLPEVSVPTVRNIATGASSSPGYMTMVAEPVQVSDITAVEDDDSLSSIDNGSTLVATQSSSPVANKEAKTPRRSGSATSPLPSPPRATAVSSHLASLSRYRHVLPPLSAHGSNSKSKAIEDKPAVIIGPTPPASPGPPAEKQGFFRKLNARMRGHRRSANAGAMTNNIPVSTSPGTGELAPIIMVCNGTGIAPFRQFWQLAASGAIPRRRMVLFFGCRAPYEELHVQEVRQLQSRRLLEYYVAYSRSGYQPCRIQEKMVEHGSRVWELIKSGGLVYVCGGTRMEAGVRDALRDIVERHGGLDTRMAEEMVNALGALQRFKTEVFSGQHA